MYDITNEDLKLVLHQSASPQAPRLVLEVLDADKRVADTITITTLVSGSLNINADSDIRRSGSFTIQPSIKEKIKLHPEHPIWLNKDLRLKLGLYHLREKKYKYYTLAYLVYDNASSVYDTATDQLSFQCSDFIRKLDGTKNGQLGSLIINFDAYEEDENGNILKRNSIRNAVIRALEQLGHITEYRIEEICEFNALPEYNDEWETYREEHEEWNTLPHDEEFSCGCSVLSILTTFRDIYPNYEMFFDPFDGNRFICQLIPFCYEDDIVLDNQFLQKVLISENSSVDMSAVRNICEVWGKDINTRFNTEKCTYSDHVYACTVPQYDTKYYNGDTVSVKLPEIEQTDEEPQKTFKLNINNLGALDIYEQSTDKPVGAGVLKGNCFYAFIMKRVKKKDAYIFRAYLLGQYQSHAIDVLSSKPITSAKSEDTNEVLPFSKEYFQEKYNCENIHFTVIPNSPFTIQKIGEILYVKTGSEYDTITSDSLALDKAIHENWKNCRLTDQITITTLLLPFLDVNIKVSYKPKNCEEERQYIIKSVSHDFAGFTSTINMYRFYPAFRSSLTEAGTHNALAGYRNEMLGRYTQDELTTILSKEDL